MDRKCYVIFKTPCTYLCYLIDWKCAISLVIGFLLMGFNGLLERLISVKTHFSFGAPDCLKIINFDFS